MKTGTKLLIAGGVFLFFGNQLLELLGRIGKGGKGGGSGSGSGSGSGGSGQWPNGLPGPGSARGDRNNNPLNLVKSGTAWKNKIPHSQNSDGKFEQFTNRIWGIRAAILNMRTRINGGANTIDKLITVWTSGEPRNDQVNYINYVSEVSGIPKDRVISFNRNDVIRLIQPMALYENGPSKAVGISTEDFNAAWNLI